MMSSSHSPPCEIQSDRSITMFSKNTTRVFRRRRREKKVSVASEETEREKETFERRRGNFSLDVLLQKSRPGEKFDSTDIRELENKTKEKETSFVFDAVVNEKESSSSSKREEREREKRRASSSSDAYLQKKTPTTPSSSREDAWEKHVCLSVCSLSICRRQKSVAKFDDVFSSLCAKRRSKSTPLNPTPLMFRVLVVQKKVL
jgi:hypothetical protein